MKALFEEAAQQAGLCGRGGLVADGEIQPVGFFDDAFIVGEGIKAFAAVIAAHAALADAAKPHMGSGKVDDGIVDAAAAEGHAGEHTVRKCFIRGKQIQRQRFWPGVWIKPTACSRSC